MPASLSVKVRGLRELNAAFKAADRTLQKELRDALRDAAEPVRVDAEALARARISNLGEAWSEMRTGVTTKVVYVAPRQRSRSGNPRRKRPNLAALLMGRSMEPALEANDAQVQARIGRALDEVGRAWEAA
jgi:hypothetical protein